MNILNYKRIEYSIIATKIQEHLKLSWDDKVKLESYLRRSDYEIVSFDKPMTCHPVLRFTAILYVIFSIILFISIPLKWIFTGKAKYDHNSLPIRIVKAWKKMLGF